MFPAASPSPKKFAIKDRLYQKEISPRANRPTRTPNNIGLALNSRACANFTKLKLSTKRMLEKSPMALVKPASPRNMDDKTSQRNLRSSRSLEKNNPTNGTKIRENICGPSPQRTRIVNLRGSQKLRENLSSATPGSKK